MADQTEAEVTAQLAIESQRTTEVHHGKRYVYRDAQGELQTLDLTDQLPAFKTGTVTVFDVEAFATYFAKHHDDDSEIYADLEKATITAVLDAHTAHGARWQQHRLVLELMPTPAWVTWTGQDRKLLKQQDFAEFLEDNIRDLAPAAQQPQANGRPVIDPAGMLELAQEFEATINASFKGGHRLKSGQTALTYVETITGGGSKDKPVEVPSEFNLAIAPFVDCETALITARFRFRVNAGGVSFMYALNSPDRRQQEAVEEITAKASAETGQHIILGQPVGRS